MKSIDDQKAFALKYCMNIALDFTESEVMRFTPLSVQVAWRLGREVIDSEINKDREKLKDFKL